MLIIVSLKANTSSNIQTSTPISRLTWRNNKNCRYVMKSKYAFCNDRLYTCYMIFWGILRSGQLYNN